MFDRAPTTFTVAGGVVHDGTANLPAAKASIPLLQCPTDTVADRVFGSQFGATNYAANAGSGLKQFGSLTDADGVFFKGSHVRFRDIKDGSSNTVAMAERLKGPGTQSSRDFATDAQRLMLEIPAGNDTTPEICTSPASGNCYSDRGAKWILGNYGNTLYNHFYPPNSSSAWDCMNLQQQKALTAASSLHSGGVMVLLCDGGVRLTSDSIDVAIWRSVASRKGSEVTQGW